MMGEDKDRVNPWLVVLMSLIIPFILAAAIMSVPIYWVMRALGKE